MAEMYNPITGEIVDLSNDNLERMKSAMMKTSKDVCLQDYFDLLGIEGEENKS